MGLQVFTTVGANTWNWPLGVTTAVAECLGGGGGGGTAQGNPCSCGGGMGGAYAKKTITKGAESSLAINVGSAGVGGGAGAGHSTVTQVSTLVCRGSGGATAATIATNTTGTGANTNTGGLAPVGDTTFQGGSGGNATAGFSGAGGSSAGPTSVGGNATTTQPGTAGTGNFADGVNYSSQGSSGSAAPNAGGAAPSSSTDYGGGGGGGAASTNPDRVGGNGRQGIVVISWTDPPVLALDETAFGFYDDGTESGSVASVAQDTNISIDTGAGNVNKLLRFRIQETSGVGVGAVGDDWQLQFSRNSGLWLKAANFAAGIVETYAFANRDTNAAMSGSVNSYGQSFIGNGQILDKVRVQVLRIGNGPVNSPVINIYATTGVHGTNAAPTGAALATSAVIPSASLPTSLTSTDFVFSGANKIVLDPGVTYIWNLEAAPAGSTSDYVQIGADTTSPAHAGNCVFNNGPLLNRDLPFEVYGDALVSPVVGFNSANLTEGQATTNRLGAGSGSFTPGEVSEDSEVDDFQWAGLGGHTELLFPHTYVAAQLLDTDTVDFRVVKNGVPFAAYTKTPRATITVTAPVAPPTKTLAAMGVG